MLHLERGGVRGAASRERGVRGAASRERGG